MQILQNLLQVLNFKKRVWFLTWSKRADQLVQHYFPGCAYFPRESISRRWGVLSMAGLGCTFEPRHSILALPAYFGGLPVFHESQIHSLLERGKNFVGYMVNDRKSFERCRVCGVEIVLTDRPDLIARWSAAAGVNDK